MLADVLNATEPVKEFTGFVMVTRCEVRQDRKGRPYLMLTFADRTGTIEARYWECGEGVDPGSRMKVQAEVNEYNNELQLKVLRWRPINDTDGVGEEHWYRTSTRDRQEMFDLVRAHRYFDRDLQALVDYLLDTNTALMLDAPAAMTNHQPYLGGLLEHITNLMMLVNDIYSNEHLYPGLDYDVLSAACVLHDIGKLYELTAKPAIVYSKEGQLLGHIVIGIQLVTAACQSLQICLDSSPKVAHVLHILVSHHGQRDWGSPVAPTSREAHLFHLLDMIDSRMGLFNELKFNGSPFLFQKGQNYWIGK